MTTSSTTYKEETDPVLFAPARRAAHFHSVDGLLASVVRVLTSPGARAPDK